MSRIKQNKRGDIPVTILVIGVFAICTLAILSFSIIDNKSKKGITQVIEAMEEANSLIEKYYFYKNLENQNSEINTNILFGIQDNEIVIVKEIDGEKIIEITYRLN